MFAEVVLSKTSSFLDKTYHYSIPDNLKIEIGQEVVVPFGKRKANGYVIGIIEKAEVEKTKDILEIISPALLFDEKTVRLARWISEHYMSFFMRALGLFIGGREKDSRKPNTERRAEENKVQYSTPHVLRSNFLLTPHQKAALDVINQSIDKNQPETFLLYGVTGSGKTEVYMRAVAQVLEKGKSAMVLEPEIGMTPQLVERFRERFQDHIAVMHSGLTDKQRKEAWKRIASGEARIILGTRLALFSPVKNPGLIVIDEEYENTYKSDMSPRYHAREVALQFGVPVILGSATPSVETYYKAEQGEYKKLVLPQRIDGRPLPPVGIIDMRRENDFVLSAGLKAELKETLERKEQAILFINRRGYFTVTVCKKCGRTLECPRCAASLTYDSSARGLRCVQCNFKTVAAVVCPACHGTLFCFSGSGTQRIEDEVLKFIPSARIIRIDRDTVSKKGSHEEILKLFSAGKADILVGTQLVTKGLDLAGVTLVGVISADTGLSSPDFRSAEHTFQLLTQIAGRAGRHHLPGKVIIQTFNPDHYAIKAAANHDYEGFYLKEIEHRKELDYPPFLKLISLLLAGPEEKKVEKTAEDMGKFLNKRIGPGVLGPALAVIPKLRGLWRYHMLLKGNDLDLMRGALKESLQKIVIPKDIKVTIDVEP